MIWFIPLGLIFILIFCGVGLAAEAIKSFVDALPFILAAIVVTVVLYGIHRLIAVFKSKRPRCRFLYSIGEVVMILSSTFGIIAFAGPTYIDRCGRWFTWFGDGLEAQIITYMCVVIIISSVVMIVAFFIPSNAISNILLLLPIILPFAIYCNSLTVSAESYSDYITTCFTSEDTLAEYEVEKDTKIYYPDIMKGDNLLPALSPIKYTSEEFKEGEIVYAIYVSGQVENFEKGSYIVVSNGSIGGMVSVDDLKDVSEPQYTYVMYDEASGYYYAYTLNGGRNYRFGVKRSADMVTWEHAGGVLAKGDDGGFNYDGTASDTITVTAE